MRSAVSAATTARGTLCAVLLVKDKARYVEKWLRFHRSVGIEHIYAYDNGLGAEALQVVDGHSAAGFVTVVPFRSASHPRVEIAPAANPQQLAYWHALTNLRAALRWMTFIDSDEFLFPAEHDDLRVAVDRYTDLPSW